MDVLEVFTEIANTMRGFAPTKGKKRCRYQEAGQTVVDCQLTRKGNGLTNVLPQRKQYTLPFTVYYPESFICPR